MAERQKGGPYSKEHSKGKKKGKHRGVPQEHAPREHGARKDQGNPIDLEKCKGIDFIEIDGSVLEGGGQILRNSVAYACLLRRPVHLVSIRRGRKSPGLKPQHLTGLRLIAGICRGQLMGDRVGSSEVYLVPGEIRGGDFEADVHTAGSVCLMLQAALPCLLLAPSASTLVLRGGTNADMAPPIDYITQVLQPILQRFGVKFECNIVKRGFYPKGGGEVTVAIEPAESIKPLLLTERGEVKEVKVESYVTSDIPPHVGPRILESCCSEMRRGMGELCPALTENALTFSRHHAADNGCGVNCVAMTTTGCYYGGNAIGKPGLPSETVGRAAGEMVVEAVSRGACVDQHLQDQIIIFMALATGKSEVLCGPLTLHTQTAIFVAEAITGVKFSQTQKAGSSLMTLSCVGLGLSAT